MYTPRTFAQVLKSAWRRPRAKLVRVPDNAVKIFEQQPPAWARWALVLVSVDVMVSTSAVDIIWNTWTMPDPELEENGGTKKSPPRDESNKGNIFQVVPPGQVLQPEWKRALSGSFFIVSGFIVAGSILAARARIVRSISYVRATPGVPSSIYLQTASQGMKFGHAYPIRQSVLLPSSQDQMMLEVKEHGKWVLDMRGSKIGNRLASPERTAARSAMLKLWKSVDGSTVASKTPKPV
ncbi:hypothetical protein CPB83DRAFT_860243 [Crepidotus variabilis]|uniref:Uncharacterized protein n=1 Tax=Crepidotus variabilis TaxID=179855 RepID=A0A9P6E9Y0_9AGAR|nr:hypothetical protein CPB83DRAFT_860243 [Crepidotus variabilis]